jgi:DNA-binding transcriptional regulator YiaG
MEKNRTPSIVSGRQIRAARVLAGLTQAQFAAKAAFHERACRYWEARGDGPPTSVLSTLARISEVLKAQGVVVFSEPTPGVRIAEKR